MPKEKTTDKEDAQSMRSAIPKAAARLENTPAILNRMAQEGRIDPLIGRKLEVEPHDRDPVRRRKNNPLYVGEAGVARLRLRKGSPA